MLFFLRADINMGVIGGYSRHGLKTHASSEEKFKDVADFTNGGYVRGFFNYEFNWINNLNIKVEAFGGTLLKDFTKDGKNVVSPSFLGGVIVKGELDFEEGRALYAFIGLQALSVQIHDFKAADGTDFKFPYGLLDTFFPTPVVGFGASLYVGKNTSLLVEISHSGAILSQTITTDQHHRVHFNNLRIGVGFSVRVHED